MLSMIRPAHSQCNPHPWGTLDYHRWLLAPVLLISAVLGAPPLYGQLLDYRLVHPPSHMQPWLKGTPQHAPPHTRIAAKWRTRLTPPHKKKIAEAASETSKAAPALPNLPNPEATDTEATEVLVVPQQSITAPKATPPQVQPLPPAQPKPTSSKTPKTESDSPTPEVSAAEPLSPPRACYEAPSLSTVTANIALPAGKLPASAAGECAAQTPPTSDPRLVGAWTVTEQHWSATCMRHRPLYFEEINAERYGYTPSYCFQPVLSAAHFFTTIPALPYKMAVDCPRDCIYTLGHYRPGSCVPRRKNCLPWQWDAAAVETGFVAGLILLVP